MNFWSYSDPKFVRFLLSDNVGTSAFSILQLTLSAKATPSHVFVVTRLLPTNMASKSRYVKLGALFRWCPYLLLRSDVGFFNFFGVPFHISFFVQGGFLFYGFDLLFEHILSWISWVMWNALCFICLNFGAFLFSIRCVREI